MTKEKIIFYIVVILLIMIGTYLDYQAADYHFFKSFWVTIILVIGVGFVFWIVPIIFSLISNYLIY